MSDTRSGSSTFEFSDYDSDAGPPITDEMIAVAEQRLGVRLPDAYVRLLRVRNGGEPVRQCHPVSFPTSWTDDHIDVGVILGVGGDTGIDSDLGRLPYSAYMVKEWGYPLVGIIFCLTPSAGHDTVMLDCTVGPEPAVVYIDEDSEVPQRIADAVEEFLASPLECPEG